LSLESGTSERNELPSAHAGRLNGNGANVQDCPSSSEDRSSQLEYWRGQLAGELPRLQLPFDRPRSSEASQSCAVEKFELPGSLAQGLKRLAEKSGCSLYVTLLAGVAILLQRYSGQDEMIVGVTSPERNPGEFAGPSDNFENLLALRLELSANPNFLELQSRVGAVFLDAAAHAGVPFSEVVKEVRLGDESAGNPLFNVVVSQTPSLPKDVSAAEDSSGNFLEELKFSFEDRGEQVCGAITYATDLFDRTTITELARHWRNLLTGACADPAKRVSELEILSADERNRIVYEWNATLAEYPNNCVHELFERQAPKTPDMTAVVSEGKTLSYRELNERANQVAHYLRKRGVGPEVLVGVCLNRTPEMVIGLLGIWKAGGAYVPLDPAYPWERLSYMMRDSAAKFLLTSGELKRHIPSADDKAILLDSDWNQIAKESSVNPESSAVPSNLAYVMYTSGSTGEPKGAMILHSGLANYLTWAIGAYGVEAGCSVPVHSSISFDLTVTSLYPALLAGGKIELLREDVGAQNLVAALKKAENRSLVKITPAHLELLSQQLSPQEAAGVTKTFVIGGEALLAENLVLWREFAPATRLINEYGPTETVVGCCVHEVRPEDPRTGPVAIGRPIANTQLYILDGNLQPVPVGVKGDLYIGGDGVARGYLNRPELTQKNFIADPFSGKSGARLYKSGDLARYRKDGTLEYLGRVDEQVKVRGYRIELGEIEAALAAHPAVQSCTVLAVEDTTGNKQLVAYAILQGNESPSAEDVKDFLKLSLPEFMVPSQIVFMDSFPLTQNGKIDRRALPAPTHGNISAAHEFIAPRTETEKKIAALWAELLNVEQIGIHDDFFDLGGHSLMAIKALSRIREDFEVDLPLATLLQAPTVAQLAALLHKEDLNPSWSLLVPVRAGGSKPPLFLMHALGGNVLDYYRLVNHLESDQPVYAFQAQGLDGNFIKGATLEEMAADYVAELQNFQPEGPYFLGGFCMGGLLALEAAEQLTAAGQNVALVIMVQSIHPGAMDYKPNTPAFKRLWYQMQKRASLEWENLSHNPKGYVSERLVHLWDAVRVRTSIAYQKMIGKDPSMSTEFSQLYFFEAVGVEHKKAMDKYRPGPYGGDVLVIRASKQLAGLIADERLGWDRTFHGKLEVCEVPGHQENLLLVPNVSQLAKEISIRLKAAQQRYFKGSSGHSSRGSARGLVLSK
jgi:amino acid adenylation domain-containing protein